MSKPKEHLAKADSLTPGQTMELAQALGIQTDLGRIFLRYSLANCILFDEKQRDYGPNNIARAGTYGCVVRMSDKFERIFNLYKTRRTKKAVNESIIDSFRDISNYGIISWMSEDGKWVTY